jgi:hypothetical protein
LLVVVEVEAEEQQVVPRRGLQEWEAQVGHMAEAAVRGVIVLAAVHTIGKELVAMEELAQSA